MKIKKLVSAIGLLTLIMVILFTGCKKDTFEKIDGVCPKVLATDPSAGATGVPLNQVITVTFNEKMNPATFNNSSFIVSGSIVEGTVSFSGVTATFTPKYPLIVDHTYTGRVTTAVKDMMGNALQQDYVWTFSTGTILSPMVIATNPFNLETDVRLNTFISATFSTFMDPQSINDSSFIVKQGSNRINGTITYSDSTAYFTPSIALDPDTEFLVTLTTKVKDHYGTPLENNYTWKFTTVAVTPPTIISTDPFDLATDVPFNKVITATFSVPMNTSSINTNSFTLKEGTNVITGMVWFMGTTAYFTPAVNLLPGTNYTAEITTEAKNTVGNSLAANYKWTFKTGVNIAPSIISTDPVNLATGVILNKIISANFSEAMDASTLNSSTFTVKQGLTPISGVVTYTGIKATFTPTVNLMGGTNYTATISTGAKNLGGISITHNYSWTFTTLIVPVNPLVIATDPLNLATGVPLNKIISATFSINMDPLTITGTTFILKQGTNIISGNVTYSNKIAHFTPLSNLQSGTTYTATVTTGAKSSLGVPILNDYVWTFTTGVIAAPRVILTDPLNNAIDVVLNKTISANFNENMNPSTLTTSSFTLKQGTSTILGTVWYSGTTVFFKPNSGLVSNATYTATISTGAKNTAGVALANNYTWTFKTKAPLGPKGPDLKSVGRFGIISGVGVSNNAGFSKINNLDVGIYPGARSSITGFPPAIIVNGAMYAADDASPAGVAAMLLQAKNDLTAAYLYAEGASSPAPATVSGDQGGKTLAPGIYKTTSTLAIQNGDLTLDAQGDANAVWIFQIAAAFTTVGGAGGNIILSGGAQAKNIYWQVGSSATIGGYTKFNGNIMALTSITMGPYATAVGRMLARNGAVVMTSTNTIDKP